MAVQRVTVTYAASPNLQSQADLWEQLRSAIAAQLPLRNLHWKSASRSSIRTVQELHINLVSFDSVPGEHASQIPASWLERPLLNFYVLTCDDVEAYKTTVRKQIKDWHAQATQRRNQEWMIVHLVSPDVRASGGSFLKMKGTVLDKIRADYNAEKRDRCVQLSWSPGKDNPTTWVDFSSKLKDGLLSAFDAVVTFREEEVKRSEGQRQMPGWNFCTFFILKESLAFLFEGMGLYEDALTEYDELESLFYQVSKEKNMTWFGTFMSPSSTDDSSPLLSLNKKAYRDLILANTITVFDFRVYMLARQCLILGMMGRFLDVCQKSSAFLAMFGKRLREAQEALPRFFVESWTYSSALSVVEQAENWARPFDLDSEAVARFSAAKGGLMEMGIHQLDAIGVIVGHLPASFPFSVLETPLATSNRNNSHSSQEISRGEILSAIRDQTIFYDLYVNLTNKTIDAYARGNRRKFAVMLHGKLAALDVHRNRLPKAYQTLSELPGHYGPGGWLSLQSFMRYQAVRIHVQNETALDQGWVMIVTEFLRIYTSDLSRELLAQIVDPKAYISALTKQLKAAASELESDVPVEDHPALTIEIPKRTARPIGTEDGYMLDVVIHNSLPSNLSVDAVRVVLAGPEAERVSFTTTGDTVLESGSTEVILRCTSSSSGPFVLDHSEVRFSKLLFQQNHRKKSHMSRLADELPVVVRIPKDPESIDIKMDQPGYIELGAPSYAQVTLTTGRNQISHATLKFSSHAGIKFDFSSASSADESFSLITAEDRLMIMNVPERTSVAFFLPHSDTSAYTAIKVNIRVEYVTDSEPNLTRTLRLSQTVPTLLPVAVNVQDFFRTTRLFTRFSVSTTSNQHVRIRSAGLASEPDSPGQLLITPCTPRSSGIVTVTPAQSANFLFKIESGVGKVGETLKLHIVYREFRKEVETLIERSVDRALEDFPALVNRQSSVVQSMVRALEADSKWITLYNITGQLEVPPIPDLEPELDPVISRIRTLLADRQLKLEDEEDTWKEIVFPVDVPQMNIVAAARVELMDHLTSNTKLSSRTSLYAGQPIQALLRISTSFHWGPETYEEKKEKTYRMRFDVEELLNDWLVSGRKRGDFLAKDGGTYTVPITLVALHHGELSLPRASVTPLPIAGEVTMGSIVLPGCETYQEHGAHRVLVLPRGGRSTYIVGMGNNE